ncbi:MAG: T9SS type A sorting domain-containing protein [Bacteroidetes bacterium]|nr:T9SS type A sorting domain-containing protein [Bacteroidota bacterium]
MSCKSKIIFSQTGNRDYAGEIGKLKWWIDERISWLDAHIPGFCAPNAVNETVSPLMLRVYPNPFTQTFHLSCLLPSINETGKAEVSIELLNMLGEHVLLKYGDKTAGMYDEEFSTSGLAPGIYTVKFSVNNISFAKKL